METQKNERAGMSPEEARRAAMVAFGGVEQTRERLREGRRAPLIEPLLRDVRFALRSLRRTPGFSLLAVVTVGLGVGATTAVFTVANTFLFQEAPLPGGETLYSIDELRVGRTSSGLEGVRVPYRRYLSYSERSGDAFSGVASRLYRNVALRTEGETRAAEATFTSGNFFTVLGLAPHLGRFYAEPDVPSAVISHRLWRESFGADPEAIGRAVYVDSNVLTVVAVAPESFLGTGLGWQPDIWIPIEAGRDGIEGPWARPWVAIFGRIAPTKKGRAA